MDGRYRDPDVILCEFRTQGGKLQKLQSFANARLAHLLCNFFHVQFDPAGENNLRAFGRKLLADRGADRAARAEQDGMLVLQDWRVAHGASF